MNFFETSAKNGEGVEEMFDEVTHQVYIDMKSNVIQVDEDGEFGIKFGPGHKKGLKTSNLMEQM